VLPRYLDGRFSRRPDRAVTVLLFGTHDTFEKECAKLVEKERCEKPRGLMGFYWPGTREILVDVSRGVRTVAHELVHPIMQSDWPAAPAWIGEDPTIRGRPRRPRQRSAGGGSPELAQTPPPRTPSIIGDPT